MTDSFSGVTRNTRWATAVDAVLVDLRRAGRRLRRTPGFTVVTTVTLALGIGASTAIFSVVRPVLLQALPYPDSERLVTIGDATGSEDFSVDVTFGTFREVVERSASVQRAAVSRPWLPTLAGDGDAERLDGQSVSADYFRVLGVAPRLGRDFTDTDDVPGAPPVAIISNGLWLRRFGADATLVGRTLTLDGAAVTVVGVMPDTFENVLNPQSGIWRPLGYDRTLPAQGREWGRHLQLLARLSPGADLDVSRRELAAIARTTSPIFPRPVWADLRDGFVVAPLRDRITTAVEPALRAVTVATVLLLVIATVNVVNLMLARGAERGGEVAACAAFGASRFRLVMPMLSEAVLLAVIGGALGVAAAYGMVGVLVTLDGVALPRMDAIRVDPVALAFAAVLSTGIGLVAGCASGLLHTPSAPLSNQRVLSTHHCLRRSFVAAEVALALVLLVGAGLLVRTVQRLMAVPPGFDPDQVLTLQVQTSGVRFAETDAVRQLFSRIHDAVQQVPEVRKAGLASLLPFTGDVEFYGVGTRDDAHLPQGADRSAVRYAVTDGFLETMRIPLLSGRGIDKRDRANSQPVVVVSTSFARRRFPGRQPVGEQLRIGANEAWFTVIGVVGDTKQNSLMTSAPEAIYVPATQWPFADRAMWVAARTPADPAVVAPRLRRAIREAAGDQPIVRVATMSDRIVASTARQRFVMTAFYAFALVALLLATIGVYGVLSAGVVERRRELALRSAIGATRVNIVALVLRQAATVAMGGMLAGGFVAVAVSRTLESFLFNVSPLDAITYAGVALLMAGATAAGALIPAWRAGRIDPAAALRS